ncbi:MAG: toprim domain-containing protein, partial [Pseudomonadales bacterium]|nr:toprim domain-containing protein [Pseudomonadales bacterium]
KTELYIVEGDSAGGSAKMGRDRKYQAILPLRGKILNVEKARIDKVLGFEEIRILIQALQCGIGEDFDISKLRYGRIVIMTDADVDGSHIRTLLLTFFFRQMPELIRHGRIYLAQPPLFQISSGKQSRFVLNEGEMAGVLTELALQRAVLVIRDEEGAERARIEGVTLEQLVKLLTRLKELATVAERRGITFTDLLATRDRDPAGEGRLPTHRLSWPEGEVLCWSEAEAQQVIAERGLILDDLGADGSSNGDRTKIAMLRELHENRELDRLFVKLEEFGLSIEDYGLVQEEAVTGEKLPTRYAWVVDAGTEKESVVEAPNIPAVLGSLHDVGRKGIEVKRYKGLGEMNPEELWDTTMDPARRALLRVTWDTASEADELFSTLMGEDVESRRTYIEDHALEVKNLDI